MITSHFLKKCERSLNPERTKSVLTFLVFPACLAFRAWLELFPLVNNVPQLGQTRIGPNGLNGINQINGPNIVNQTNQIEVIPLVNNVPKIHWLHLSQIGKRFFSGVGLCIARLFGVTGVPKASSDLKKIQRERLSGQRFLDRIVVRGQK